MAGLLPTIPATMSALARATKSSKCIGCVCQTQSCPIRITYQPTKTKSIKDIAPTPKGKGTQLYQDLRKTKPISVKQIEDSEIAKFCGQKSSVHFKSKNYEKFTVAPGTLLLRLFHLL